MSQQYEPEQLQTQTDQKLKALEEAQVESPALSVKNLEGADVETHARGALRVRPNSHRVVSLPAFSSSVKVVYDGVPAGDIQIRTGSARLIRVNGSWRSSALAAPMQKERRAYTPGGVASFTFHLPENKATAILPPKPATQGVGSRVFPVPKPATAVEGRGILRYRSGFEVEVDGTQTVLRPGADGSLQARRGSVHADMLTDLSADTPRAKIGPTWITLKRNISA